MSDISTHPDAAALFTACIDAYNQRDFDRGAELFSENALQVDKALGATHIGPAGRQAIYEDSRAKFPDSQTEIVQIWAGGDTCSYLAVFRGTTPGDEPVEIEFMGHVTSEDGKITSSIKYYDSGVYPEQS